MVDSGGEAMGLSVREGEVLRQCEVCRVLLKAPHLPIAGASSVSSSNDGFQVDLLFSGDAITLRLMDVSSAYSLLGLVRSENPLEVRDDSCSSWLAIFGKPDCI